MVFPSGDDRGTFDRDDQSGRTALDMDLVIHSDRNGGRKPVFGGFTNMDTYVIMNDPLTQRGKPPLRGPRIGLDGLGGFS